MANTKRASKVIVLLLSLLMAFSFISTVSAASVWDSTKTSGTLTLNKLYSDTGITEAEYNALSPADQAKYVKADDNKYYEVAVGAKYTIYKIATLEQTTTNGDVKVYYKDVVSGAEVDVKALNASSFNLTGYSAAKPEGTTDSSGNISFTGLDLGLYLVKETGLPDGVANANSFFVQVPMPVGTSGTATSWEYDVVAYPKNSKTGMKLTKEYVSGGVNDADGNVTANLGDTINYKITATVPSDFKTTKDSVTTVNYTKFNIVDKASKYLTVINSATTPISVKINGTTADSSYYTVTGPTLTTDTNDGKQYNYTTIEFTAAGLAALNNSDVITVEYSAKIAAKIDDGDTTNTITNTSYIEYTPNGGNPGTVDPTDPDPTDPTNPVTPIIYLYSYTLKKVDGDGAVLGGAKFVLQKGTNYLKYDTTNGWGTTTNISEAYVVTSNSTTGFVTFSGLAYGTDYALVETEAPAGYTLLKESISGITIDKTTTATTDANSFSKTVENHKNSTIILPETGGNGIYLFLLVGGALIATAIVLYAVSKKKTNNAK